MSIAYTLGTSVIEWSLNKNMCESRPDWQSLIECELPKRVKFSWQGRSYRSFLNKQRTCMRLVQLGYNALPIEWVGIETELQNLILSELPNE